MKSDVERISKKERAVQRALGTWSLSKEYKYRHRIKKRFFFGWLYLVVGYLLILVSGVIWDWQWTKHYSVSLWILPFHALNFFIQDSNWFDHKFFGPHPTEEECNENW